MNSVLAYEKKLYFRGTKEYLTSWITQEDNYLIWKYISYLRREEAAKNKVGAYFWRRKKNRLGSRLGLQIYANTCARGLHIWHYGSVIISGDAVIGENCTFHGQACIGNDGIDGAAPVLGRGVDVGVGAKIIGGVHLADGVRVGAGAVVVRDCLDENAVLVGVPARVVSKTDKNCL